MTVKVTYPHLKRKIERMRVFRFWAKLGIVFASFVCILVNFLVKGPAWSAIVVWAGWTAWVLMDSPDFGSCNRISLWSKFVVNATVLLVMITYLFSRGASWGIPLTWFIGECVAGVLFFTDMNRQRQNISPMLLLLCAGFLAAIVAMIITEVTWVLLAVALTAVAILIACVIVLKGDFIRAFKKTMHII